MPLTPLKRQWPLGGLNHVLNVAGDYVVLIVQLSKTALLIAFATIAVMSGWNNDFIDT